jgi:hypothetical protein
LATVILLFQGQEEKGKGKKKKRRFDRELDKVASDEDMEIKETPMQKMGK